MRLTRRAALAAPWALWLGCEGEPKAPAFSPVEVFSWGNRDVLGAVAAQHEQDYPSDELIHANAQLSGEARKVLRKRLLSGEPPDAFLANVGYDHRQWVEFNGMDAHEAKVQPLDWLFDDELRAAFPAALLSELSHGHAIYGVPAHVHRINQIFYNRAVLQRAGRPLPRGVDELLALGERLRRLGIPLFAVGSKAPWTLSLLIFESLLVAQHGARFYERYFRGELSPEDPRIESTLRVAIQLMRYANADHAELDWQEAADRVQRGEAAMTAIGDWARTLFSLADPAGDPHFAEAAFPGTEEVIVYTSNTYSLPLHPKNEAGARRFLTTLASRAAQQRVADGGSALPARIDVVVPPGDSIQAEKAKLWREGKLVLAQSGLVPPIFAADVNAALAEMLRQGNPSPVLHTLKMRYFLLR